MTLRLSQCNPAVLVYGTFGVLRRPRVCMGGADSGGLLPAPCDVPQSACEPGGVVHLN